MKYFSALLALTLGMAQAVCSGQEFSADVMRNDGNDSAGSAASASYNRSRLFVSNEKLRLEMGGPEGTVLLVNGAEQTAYAIFPAKKEYQPWPAVSRNISE
jgi:hypothetical protein